MIDLLLVAILGGVTWFVSSEGAWSAGVTFLSVLFAGLLAMNFFEPVAILLGSNLPAYDAKMDMIALVGLFAALVLGLRELGERMAPTYVQLPAMIEQIGRWVFGVATGYVTMAFLLTALHTAPLPREFIGFTPERNNLFGMVAPDRQWLGFTQYVSEHAFSRDDLALAMGAPLGTPHGFDAPFHQIGKDNNTYANLFWPSFPIRYAMRREQYGAGGGAAPAQPVGPVPVTPAPGFPASPGGGPAPAF